MASSIGKVGWLSLYAIALTIDAVQFLVGIFEIPLSALGVGVALIAINEAADPFIGLLAVGYFQIKGVNVISNWKRMASLLCVGGIDELTGGIASLWFLDVWYIRRDVQREEARIRAEQEAQQQQQILAGVQQRLYVDGRRNPAPQDSAQPAYKDGTRIPTIKN